MNPQDIAVALAAITGALIVGLDKQGIVDGPTLLTDVTNTTDQVRADAEFPGAASEILAAFVQTLMRTE